MDREDVQLNTETVGAEESKLPSVAEDLFLFVQVGRYHVNDRVEYLATVTTAYGKVLHSAGTSPLRSVAEAKARQWATLHKPTSMLFSPDVRPLPVKSAWEPLHWGLPAADM